MIGETKKYRRNLLDLFFIFFRWTIAIRKLCIIGKNYTKSKLKQERKINEAIAGLNIIISIVATIKS